MDYAGVLLAGLGIGYGLAWMRRFIAALDLPMLSEPITDGERKALDDISVIASKLDDALIRLKHAEQDKARAERDAAQVRAEMWGKEKKLRDIGRILEREAVPMLAGDEAEWVATEERAG